MVNFGIPLSATLPVRRPFLCRQILIKMTAIKPAADLFVEEGYAKICRLDSTHASV
jgi:hypothetical protein